MSQSDKPGKSAAKLQADSARVPRKRKSASAPTVVDAAQGKDDAAPTPFRIVLNSDLRIGAAKDLYARLVNAEGEGELVLVADEVARVDAAGIQAVLAALGRISDSGRVWRWHNPSSTLVQGIELLGLKAHLRLQ